MKRRNCWNGLIAGLWMLGAAVGLCTAARAQEPVLLLRQPTISKTSIVFVYGGDLWEVPRSGGNARRLTANPSIKRFPHFSPDGKRIAFTGNYDGNSDVYVIPAEGGEPKRLTYHPAADGVLGWTPDGSAVLFRSQRNSFSPRFMQLFTVPLAGGLEKELPLPEAGSASFSPDGDKIAYNRVDREFATWKRYRGGLQAYVSIYDLNNNRYSELPHTDATDLYPMWHGDKIYFVSDRTDTANLYSFDLKTKAVKQLTRYADYDVKWPSLGPDAIVFEQGGAIRTLDLNTEKVATVPIQVHSDMAAARPELRHVESNIESFAVSPSGARALFEARGDLFTVPAKKGDSRDLTNTPGVREIDPAWSPDGRNIAYFSDRSGEYDLYIRPQDGSGSETRLTTDGHVYRYGLNWSPDSKTLLYNDAAMRLWMVNVADRKPVLLDSSTLGTIDLGHWSPDSKWIAYTKPNASRLSQIMLYSVDQRKAFPVSGGEFNDTQPVFDLNGKYLYFLSDRTFTPSIVGPELNINLQNTTGVFALILQADGPSPFGPESDEEKPKEETPAPTAPPAKPGAKLDTGPPAAKADASKSAPANSSGSPAPVRIDLDGLGHRVVGLPIPAGNYNGLQGGNGKVLYLAGSGPNGGSGGTLHEFDMSARKDSVLLGGINSYDINPTATKIIYEAPGHTYGIIDAAPGQAVGAGKLTLDLEMRADPRAEWQQIFKEAWRLERDFYYDPNMHGLDWNAIGARYARLLPGIAYRDDLTYLLGELVGELNTSHAYVMGAENPPVPQVNGGLLGVDFEPSNGYYRLKKIYPGENWTPDRRSPLTEAGVKVKEGDYLIAVNGVPLHTDTNPYAPFEGTAGKIVTLKINDKPSEVGAHDVQVRPIGNETGLRYLDWVENNRRKVEEATNGRCGYIHVPDTSLGGISEFARGFYSQTDKEALIVDERYNSGGFIPDFFVEKLARKLLSIGTPRYGMDFDSPNAAIYGPKVMLTNEWAGSGGDAFPYYFRKAGVGPLIGKRTWGGLVGINGSPPLMDGGAVTVPQFGIWSPQDGKWIAENHGIDPDIEVNNTPDLTSRGRDPQLERAIAYIQDQLKKNPPPKYHHPPFSVEKLPKASPQE